MVRQIETPLRPGKHDLLPGKRIANVSKRATLQCKLSRTAMTLIQGLSSLFWSTGLLIT